jgi:hypothetical protein
MATVRSQTALLSLTLNPGSIQERVSFSGLLNRAQEKPPLGVKSGFSSGKTGNGAFQNACGLV